MTSVFEKVRIKLSQGFLLKFVAKTLHKNPRQSIMLDLHKFVLSLRVKFVLKSVAKVFAKARAKIRGRILKFRFTAP